MLQRDFVIECKKLYGNVVVNEKGDFIRTYRGRKQPEGIYSPFNQNRRHVQLIREMKQALRGVVGGMILRGTFDDVYKGLIVLANERTVVDDSAAPVEVRECIVRADRLVWAIAELNDKRGIGRDKLSMKDVRENAEWFLERHKEGGGADLAAKYREMVPATAPVSGELTSVRSGSSGVLSAERPVTPAAPVCPRCGSPMVLRTAKRGPRVGQQFYGCTRFPDCRGIVNIEGN